MKDIHPLVFISVLIPLIPLGAGLIFMRRLGSDRKLLLLLMGISLLTQLIGFSYFIESENNLFIYHIYMPIEFILLGYIYKLWLSDWWKKELFDMLIWSFVAFSIFNAVFLQPLDESNSYAIFVGGICLIVFSITFFYKTLSELREDSLEKNPRFWINTSILLYYSGSLLILGMDHLLTHKSKELYATIWYFHSSFNILHYLLFTVALCLKPREVSSNF